MRTSPTKRSRTTIVLVVLITLLVAMYVFSSYVHSGASGNWAVLYLVAAGAILLRLMYLTVSDD